MALAPGTQEFYDLKTFIDAEKKAGNIKTGEDLARFLKENNYDVKEYFTVNKDYEKAKKEGTLDVLYNTESYFDPGKIIGKAVTGIGEGLIDLSEVAVDVMTGPTTKKYLEREGVQTPSEQYRGALNSAANYVDDQLMKTDIGKTLSYSFKQMQDPRVNAAEDIAATLIEFATATGAARKVTSKFISPKSKTGKFLKFEGDAVIGDVLTRDKDEQFVVDFLSQYPEAEEYVTALAINPDDTMAEARLKQSVDSAIAAGVISLAVYPAIIALRRGGKRLFGKQKAFKTDSITKPIANTDTRTAHSTRVREVGDGIFNQSSKITELVGKINTGLGRVFTSKAGLPDPLFKSYIRKQRFAESKDLGIQTEAKALKKLLKKYADQGNPINLQIVNLAEETPVSDIYKILSNAPDEALSVAGKRLKELNTSGLIPNDVLNQIATMRQQIDKNEFIIKDFFNISDDSKLGIKMDDMYNPYLTRTFETFTNPKWSKDIMKGVKGQLDPDHNADVLDIIARARRHIKNINPNVDLTDAQVNGIISNIVRDGKKFGQTTDFFNLLDNQKAGQNVVKILKNKKDLDKPILDLLGEVKDPIRNFTETMRNQNKLIAEVQYLKEIKKFAEENLGQEIKLGGLFPFLPQKTAKFLRKAEVTPTETVTKELGGLAEPLGAFGGKAKLGLNKYVTTNELYDMLEKGIDLFDLNQAGRPLLYGLYRKGLGLGQAMETIFDHTAHLLNTYGMTQQLAMNGYLFRPKVFKRGYKAAKTMYTRAVKDKDPEAIAMLQKMKEEGIIDSSLIGETVKANLDRFGEDIGNPIVDGLRKSVEAPLKGASALYGGVDDFGKIIAMITEMEDIKRAYPNMSANEIFSKAAERVRNVMPSYSTAIPAVRALGTLPFGAYATFPAEILRNQFHILRIGVKDIKEGISTGNTNLIKNGFSRLAATGAVTVGIERMINQNNEDQGVTSINQRAADLLVPDYQRNTKKLFTDPFYYDPKSKHVMTKFVDTGFIDAQQYTKGPIRRIIGTLMAGGDITERELEDTFSDIARDLYSPFLGEKFLTGAILNAARGVDENGRAIEGDYFLDRLVKQLAEVYKPGAYKNAKRYFEAVASEKKRGEGEGRTRSGFPTKSDEQLFFNLTGIRNNTMDVTKAVGYSIYQDLKLIGESKQEFKTYINSLPDRKFNEDDIQDIYQKYIDIQKEKQNNMARLTDKLNIFRNMEFQILNKDGTINRIEKFGVDGILQATSSDYMYKVNPDVIRSLIEGTDGTTQGIFMPDMFTEKELFKFQRDGKLTPGIVQGLLNIQNSFINKPLRKVE